MPRASCKVCVQCPVSSHCPLPWSHREPFSLHSRQDGQWLVVFLVSAQHSSFKEDLLKAQVFPELLRQCHTSVLSHHFQQLSSAAELVFQKSAGVTVSTGTLSLASDLCAHEKSLCRTHEFCYNPAPNRSFIFSMKTVSQTTQLGFTCIFAGCHLFHLC